MKPKSKSKVIEVEVMKPGQVAKPEPLKEFEPARALIADIRELGQRAQHKSLLLGFELNKLKLAIGSKHGGDRKSEKSSSHGDNLIPWDKLVEQQTGLSYPTCQRWMTIAKGAAKSLPILMAPDVLKKPFNELPATRQTEVLKVLNKAADGHTMAELMVNFGIWTYKKPHTPPKPTKASAAKRAANAADEVLTQEELMDLAKDHLIKVEDFTMVAAFKALDTDHLASFENAAKALHEAITAELKERRKAK